MAWPSTSRMEVVAVLWRGILSAPPAKKAAGSIATAISTKNSAPICHGSRASKAWVASDNKRVDDRNTLPLAVLHDRVTPISLL